MKTKVVGTYWLGHQPIKIILLPGDTGGDFDLAKDKEYIAEIKIHAEDKFPFLMGILMHEIWEAAMTIEKCRFEKTHDFSHNTARYLFLFDHTQFAIMAANVGAFIHACHRDLYMAWKEFTKKPKAKTKKRKIKRKK